MKNIKLFENFEINEESTTPEFKDIAPDSKLIQDIASDIPLTPGTIFVIGEDKMVEGKYYRQIEKLMGVVWGDNGCKVKLKELYGTWKLKSPITLGKFSYAELDFYVKDNKVFEEMVMGSSYDIQKHFGNKTSGKFRITYIIYNHSEGGPTPLFEIHILK
jgi:hypothetical protein